MSNNQTTPDAFSSFDQRFKIKGNSIISKDETLTPEDDKNILSWKSNPILGKVARELEIGKDVVGFNKVMLNTGDALPTFGARLGMKLGEGRSELSLSFLGQLDLGVTNAMSDVIEVYNNADRIVLPERVTSDNLRSTIEKTILKYMEYDITSGDISIGVEGIKDYVSRYSELLTKASALIILQSPNSDILNDIKVTVGERRVQLIEEIKDLEISGGDRAVIESKTAELNENNSEKVMEMLGKWVFNSSMMRMNEQLEVIRGLVSLNSAINKNEIFRDVRNDQKLDEKKRLETEKQVRRENYGREGAPLGERIVRNFIILTGTLRIRALPTRGELDNIDNAKDNLRVEKFIDKVQVLLKKEFNRVTLTIISVAIFPVVATVYGVRQVGESQTLKDVFEEIFGPPPVSKPSKEKFDNKDRPEPGKLVTTFLGFLERVLPKRNVNSKTEKTSFIQDSDRTGVSDIDYRYMLAALALIPVLCISGATLEAFLNRSFRNNPGLNTQMPEFPTSGQPIPIPSPTPIGTVIGNTNPGAFQDPAAGDIGMPEILPRFISDPILNPNLNSIYANFTDKTILKGDTLFATLEKVGYDPINDFYDPNSKFYTNGEAATIIRANFGSYSYVEKVLSQIVINPGENSKRQYDAINSITGGYLPDFASYISNPNQLVDNKGVTIPIFVTSQIGNGQFNPNTDYKTFTDVFRLLPEYSNLFIPSDLKRFRVRLTEFLTQQKELSDERKAPTP